MHLLKTPLTLFLVLAISANLFCQNRHADTLASRSYKNDIDFSYDIVNGDTVLNGPFSLQSYQLDSLFTRGSGYCKTIGYFDINRPDSTWNFLFSNFTATGGATLYDHYLKVNIRGLRHEATARFNKGEAEGKWTHRVKEMNPSESESEIFSSSIVFNQGIPRKTLRIETGNATLLGRFLRNGLAHDTWLLNNNDDPDQQEKWVFSAGILEKIIITGNPVSTTLPVYKATPAHCDTINLDDRFFSILTLQHRLNPAGYSSRGGRIAGLLKEHASYYSRIADQLNPITNSVSMPVFGVQVASYPFSEPDEQHLAMLKELMNSFLSETNNLIENTQLNILKYSDDEVRFLLEVAKKLKNTYVAPVNQVLRYDKDQLLTFLPPDDSMLLKTPPTMITVSYHDSTDNQPRSYQLAEDTSGVNSKSRFSLLVKRAETALASVSAIQDKIVNEMQQDQLQQELEDLENNLVQRADSLTETLDSLAAVNRSKQFLMAISGLENRVSKEIGEYSQTDNLIRKRKRASELINCFERMEQLAYTMGKLPAREDSIRQLYTEQVWNPFTATTMTDRVKEALTQSYIEVVIPSLLAEIASEMPCSEAENYRQTLNTLYQRMLELRREKTSKIERKLRNEDNPEVILQLLNVTMNP